jgi:hypothetical protein
MMIMIIMTKMMMITMMLIIIIMIPIETLIDSSLPKSQIYRSTQEKSTVVLRWYFWYFYYQFVHGCDHICNVHNGVHSRTNNYTTRVLLYRLSNLVHELAI